jgi:diketogulonate reductase-like aldo/keto reductase
MPQLGFGTFMASGEDCRKSVLAAIDAGFTHIDTAELYGNEEDVGRAVRESRVKRESLFIATKTITIGKESQDLPVVRQSLETSLRKLQLDYIDLYMIHWEARELPLEDILSAMTVLKEEGKIRQIGVCNFPIARLKAVTEILGYQPFCNQIEFHPFVIQDKLTAYCRESSIITVGYYPLAQGRSVKEPVLLRIGEEYGKSAAQVALRWAIQHPLTGVLSKSVTPERIHENIQVYDFRLSPEDMEAITRLKSPEGRINTQACGPHIPPTWDDA